MSDLENVGDPPVRCLAERRTWGVSEQKIIGARQKWRCACCDELLPACYECDHVVPLWKGGRDDYETNAQALCPTCHAAKTQRESIERHNQLHAARVAAVKVARAADPLPPTLLLSPPQAQPARKRRERPLSITDPAYVDPLLAGDNPFLRFTFVG